MYLPRMTFAESQKTQWDAS